MKGVNHITVLTTPQFKPRFYLFQRVRDQLYLTPPTVTEHTSQTGTYLGTLGFTKPLEQLVLCTMSLQSLLDWLSKPKGPNLVKASEKAVPYKALAIAVTKRVLYEEKPPLVEVGLVYKPHYISTVAFSAAYMHLNVWHSAGSTEESENQLNAPHLLFVDISEMSNVIPVVVRHPILLDVASKEAREGTGEPVSPFSFRGFRLHMVWTQHPGGEMTQHISFPFLLGESNSTLTAYESEKFPQGLRQGQKIGICLKPSTKDHWNTTLDLILPLVLEDYRQRHEAKRAARAQDEKSEGAKVSQTEAPTPGESPQLEAGGSDKALPTKMAPNREQVLETTREILAHIHALHLQTMHEMGSVREVDQTLTRTLMAESARLQLRA